MNATRTWQQKLYFFSLIAVLYTTLFSWFNINSLCIMLLLVSRLLYRPVAAFKNSFTNAVFLTFLAYCVIGAAAIFYTHNMLYETRAVSRESTLAVVAFVWCAGDMLDGPMYKRLLTWYYLLLFAASLYCLLVACHNYRLTGDPSVFFYHLLTRPISQNAVFFSVFVVFGLVFLLAPFGAPVPGGFSPGAVRYFRVFLVLFFLAMVILLNSKLDLVIALLLVIHALLRRYSFKKNKLLLIGTGFGLLAVVVFFAATDNPISRRFRDMNGDLALIRQKEFDPGVYFNPLQLRLLEWRFASEILHEHRAWLFGVTPGDSQDLLDQKYIQAHMFIGDTTQGPHRHIRGFIGYNFHNQYLETTVRSGLLGLAALLGIFATLFAAAWRHGTREAWFVILILFLFFIPQAPLTLQHGVFLFCFFPFLALAVPKKTYFAGNKESFQNEEGLKQRIYPPVD
jgi:O-antigen ligase